VLLDRIEGRRGLLVEGLTDPERVFRHQQRVTVRVRRRDIVPSDVTARPRLVLDDDGLAQCLSQLLSDLAGKGVPWPAREGRAHQSDRPAGIGRGCLRLRQGRGAEHGPCTQAPSKEIAHGPPPSLHPAHGPLAAIGSRARVGVDRTRALLPRCRTCASEGEGSRFALLLIPTRTGTEIAIAAALVRIHGRVSAEGCAVHACFPVNNRRKTGAVNATQRKSKGNRDGSTKRTGNNRAVTGKSQAPTSAQRCRPHMWAATFCLLLPSANLENAESWKILVTRVKKIPLTCSRAANRR